MAKILFIFRFFFHWKKSLDFVFSFFAPETLGYLCWRNVMHVITYAACLLNDACNCHSEFLESFCFIFTVLHPSFLCQWHHLSGCIHRPDPHHLSQPGTDVYWAPVGPHKPLLRPRSPHPERLRPSHRGPCGKRSVLRPIWLFRHERCGLASHGGQTREGCGRFGSDRLRHDN